MRPIDGSEQDPRPQAARLSTFLGPAFLVAVGYIDPGNWAANLEAGSRFGYRLLWVLLASNALALLFQNLAARLGVVSGANLAQNCRSHFPRLAPLLGLAAVAAMIATDLAEVLGAALGIHLLLGVPLPAAAFMSGAAVLAILALSRRGHRPLEVTIFMFIAVIGAAYVVELAIIRPPVGPILKGVITPSLDLHSVYLAAAMLGATVMPHNLFLHSETVRTRLRHDPDPEFRRGMLRLTLLDSVLALNLAWLINSAIVVMAAAAFFARGIKVVSISEAHRTLEPLFGAGSAAVFAVALTASGLSSATTGTLAGQIVLEGFTKLRVGVLTRRLVTLLPALAVILAGWDEVRVLVASQAFLALALPFAVIPLLVLTSRQEIMKEHTSGWMLRWAGALGAALVVALDVYLLAGLL